ncbi:MAG: hypothetical protein AMXMBFR34_45980 [Myxococcaceae bacterium]
MVEQFTAELFGEIVWTTNQDSQLIRGAGSCTTPTGTSCTATTTTFSWPTGWTYGGTALRGVEIESQAPHGILPTRLSADPAEVVKTKGAKIAWECGLADGSTSGPGLSCGYSSLTIVGAPREVFRAWVGPFNRPSSPPAAYGFSVPFYPRAASRCALRSFSATSGGTGGTTDAIWLGANSTDCGWSPGNVYNGSGLHGFEAAPSASPEVEFSLDATRLP